MELAPIPIYGNKYEQLAIQANMSRFHMALTHLVLEDKMYRYFYKDKSDKGQYIILDNSLIEKGESLGFGDVLKAAQSIQAHEIVLPDKLMDRETTVRLVLDSLRYYIPHNIMAVAQGDSFEEFIKCIYDYLHISEIDVIGIPKATAKLTFDNARAMFLQQLDEHNVLDDILESGKEIHLLGANEAGDFVHDFDGKIRSIDSVLPSWMAKNNLPFKYGWYTNSPNRPEGKINHRQMDIENQELAVYNIGIAKGWVYA